MADEAADPVDMLSRALDQTGAVLAGIHPSQAELPTPCLSWDVRTLVDHIVEQVGQFTAQAAGAWPDRPAFAATDDWLTAYRKASYGLVDAWVQAGDLEGTIELPNLGEVPARFPIDQQVAEFAVHSWDLVTATGQTIELDPEIGQAALDWARQAMRPEFRGDEADGYVFGPETPIADDAPVYDRLAAFFGRHLV
jgi:uncharacterized protein (TIGR03086 family)